MIGTHGTDTSECQGRCGWKGHGLTETEEEEEASDGFCETHREETADQNGVRRTRGSRPGTDRRRGVVRADVSQVGGARGEGVLARNGDGGDCARRRAALRRWRSKWSDGEDGSGSDRRASDDRTGLFGSEMAREAALWRPDWTAAASQQNDARGGGWLGRGPIWPVDASDGEGTLGGEATEEASKRPEGGFSEGWWRSELAGGGSWPAVEFGRSCSYEVGLGILWEWVCWGFGEDAQGSVEGFWDVGLVGRIAEVTMEGVCGLAIEAKEQ